MDGSLGLRFPVPFSCVSLLPSGERKFRNEPRMPKNHGTPAHRGHESNDLTEARGFINKIECGGQGLFYI